MKIHETSTLFHKPVLTGPVLLGSVWSCFSTGLGENRGLVSRLSEMAGWVELLKLRNGSNSLDFNEFLRLMRLQREEELMRNLEQSHGNLGLFFRKTQQAFIVSSYKS